MIFGRKPKIPIDIILPNEKLSEIAPQTGIVQCTDIRSSMIEQ